MERIRTKIKELEKNKDFDGINMMEILNENE